MKLEHLEYFCKIEQGLSLNVLSEKMHISQQGLSATIKKLETEMECQLLERTGKGVYYTDPNGYNWTADYISSKGDAVVDLTRDMAAEEEARITYEWLINLTNDPDIIAPLVFLREREIVHYQRFGEALMDVREFNNCKRYF